MKSSQFAPTIHLQTVFDNNFDMQLIADLQLCDRVVQIAFVPDAAMHSKTRMSATEPHNNDDFSNQIRSSAADADPQSASDFAPVDHELLAFVRRCLALSLPKAAAEAGQDTHPRIRSKDGDALLSGSGRLDDNFDRYAFVRNIRRRVDALVAPMLAEQLRTVHAHAHAAAPAADPSSDSVADNLVPSIVDKVIASPEYSALVQNTLADARRSVASLLEHLKHRAPFEDSSGHAAVMSRSMSSSLGRSSSQEPSFSAHSNTTCESSSMGSISSGACPGTDELKHMLARMHPAQPYESRMAASQRLASFSVGDMLTDEFWPDARRAMELAIADADTRIACIGLKIFARAFRTAPPYMAPEVYLSFVAHLVHVFENTQAARIAAGLDTRDPRIDLFLKKFRLLMQFMMDIPSLWCRFPEQVFKDVMSLTFRLLRSPRKWAGSITPLHYIAVVDPRAAWFEKWMMGNLGRAQVVAAMQHTESLIDLASAFVGHVMVSSSSDADATAITGRGTSHHRNNDSHINSNSSIHSIGNNTTGAFSSMHHDNNRTGKSAATDDLLVEDFDPNDDGDTAHLISKSDLDHVHFLHVSIMLARLSTTTYGRRHFPIRIEDSTALSSSPTSLLSLLQVPEADGQSPVSKYELSLRSFIIMVIQKMTIRASLMHPRALNTTSTSSVSISLNSDTNSVGKTSETSDVRDRDGTTTRNHSVPSDMVAAAVAIVSAGPTVNTTSVASDRERDLAESLSMSRFMARILRNISCSESLCSEDLYKDDVVHKLVHPVSMVLESGGLSSVDEGALLAIAETLSNIATTDKGRKFILRGESLRSSAKHGNSVRSHASTVLPYEKTRHEKVHANMVLDPIATLIKLLLRDKTMHASTTESTVSTNTTNQNMVKGRSSGSVQSTGLARRVAAGFIFFLRQLYRTCEGLLWLQHHDLHVTLSRLLFCSADGGADSDWIATLIDNLLNFAATPKGVMLLQQTGAMQPCVAYMFQRYQKKLQVSKCEKFGYGTLVSQVSTTRSGTDALWRSGLVQSFLHDIWGLLSGERAVNGFSVLPDIDDHAFSKAMYNVVKIFLSFPALATCLDLERAQMVDMNNKNQNKDTKGLPVFPHDTFSYLVQKLVLVDQDLDDNWLVCHEESHQVGLRILRLVISSLDSLILMETVFRFQESLMRQHVDAHILPVRASMASKPVFVLDANSLMRNHILLASLCIGGPGERVLPPTTIPTRLDNSSTTSDLSHIPVFDGSTLPTSVVPVIDQKPLMDTSSAACVKILKVMDASVQASSSSACLQWLLDIRSVISSAFDEDLLRMVPLPICQKLLSILPSMITRLDQDGCDQVGWCMLGHKNHLDCKPAALATSSNSSVNTSARKLGTSIASRYAARFLPFDKPTMQARLDDLLCRADAMSVSSMQDQPVSQNTDKMKKDQSAFVGFDWFASTVLILAQGDVDVSASFLSVFAQFLPALFMWARRPQIQVDTINMASASDQLLESISCHLVEAILETELPMVSSAFTLSGCTPTQMCQRWFRECFWNVLPIPEITNYMIICMTHGVDYQVYFAIALIRHLRERILVATRDGALVDLICGYAPSVAGGRESDSHLDVGCDLASGFSAAEMLEYMHGLRDRHRDMVMMEMRQTASGLSSSK